MASVGVRLNAQLGAGFWALALRFIVEFTHLKLFWWQTRGTGNALA